MKILFDQCVPQPLRAFLKAHEVSTAKYMDWGSLKNGELLAQSDQAGFECLLTADQNLKYQQNLTHRKISIFVVNEIDWRRIKPTPRILLKPFRISCREHGI